jgi:multisubunit Na+/H+ antiporter MnhC subunit
MTVPLMLIIVMAVLYACGVYLMLERSLTRVLLGFLLVGNATNLLIITMAGEPGAAPIVTEGITADDITDPLPQALILTAIVINFGVSAFLMALIYRSWRLAHADAVTDDEADVAMRTGIPSVTPEASDAATADTEFGTLAEAAVPSARDLADIDHDGDPTTPDPNYPEGGAR